MGSNCLRDNGPAICKQIGVTENFTRIAREKITARSAKV